MAKRPDTEGCYLPIKIFGVLLICVNYLPVKVSADIACDFEDSTTCGFLQETNDIFDWTIDSGGTSSSGTGPSVDHTTGSTSGNYIYIEASSPRVNGDSARFASPTLRGNSNGCYVTCTFYYHMYGDTIGELNVRTRSVDEFGSIGSLSSTIWAMSRNQGDQWHYGNAAFTAYSNFRIIFEGIRGSSFTGDIALDDIVISECDDVTPPVITGCPGDIRTTTELTNFTTGARATWNEPTATDLSGTPQRIRSHAPSSYFTAGVTQVTYTFVDTWSNTATCTFSVIVQIVDTTPPLVTNCPQDFDSVAERHVLWPEPTVFDISGDITISKSHSSGMFLLTTTPVDYIFRDSSNNVAYCNFTISAFYDTSPPAINGCHSDINISIESGEPGAFVSWTIPTAMDGSGTAMMDYFTHTPNSYFSVGSSNVLYSFVDESHNEAQCSFAINVEQVDTTPPVLKNCPSDIVKYIELGTASTPVYWSSPSASDVSGHVSLVSQSHFSSQRFTTGRTNVSYRFADRSGNEVTCTFNVVLEEVDSTPPSIDYCPEDITQKIEIGDIGDIPGDVTWMEPRSSDVSGNVTLSPRSRIPKRFSPYAETGVTYIFTDQSANEAICEFVVSFEIVDSTPPVLNNCPSDIVKYIELGTPSTPVYWSSPSASDVSGHVSLVSQSHFPGNRFTTGRTNVDYSFADKSGNEVTCAFNIAIKEVDTTPPSIDYCPEDITQTIEIGVTTASVSWMEPRSSDLSGNVTLSSRSRIPKRFSPYAETGVKYIFTDQSANEAFCEFLVSFEIVDSTPPSVIACPTNINTTLEVGLLERAVSWPNPVAMDLSGNVVSTSSHQSDQTFPVGCTHIMYIFEDDSLNRAECNFTVCVESVDTTPPDITQCPSDIYETIEVGNTKSIVFWSEPVAIDISGNSSLISQSHSSGNYFTIGKTDVSYLFVDGSGNAAACNFSVILTFVDTKAPDIVHCPSNIIAYGEMGLFGAVVSWTEPSAVDASVDVTLLVKTHTSGQLFAVGTTSVTYLFTDSFNNMATCNFLVTLSNVDTTPPDITQCPSDIYETIEVGNTKKIVSWSEPVAIDISGNSSLMSQSHSSGDYFTIGKTDVCYLFVDGSGNAAACNFSVIITFVDTKAPDIVHCPSNIIASGEMGLFGAVVSWTDPSAVDASGDVTLLVKTHTSGQLFAVGTTSVTYLFTDSFNNMATCNFLVTISNEDLNSTQILNCPLDILSAVEIGTSNKSVSWTEPSAYDQSGNMRLLESTHTPGNYFPIGSTQVSYTFLDGLDNGTACDFVVTITQVDTKAPEILHCPFNINASVEVGSCGTVIVWSEPYTIDESGSTILLVKTHTPGELFPVGTTSVTYLFADSSTNMATCSFFITINTEDTNPPTILSCPSDIHLSTEIGTLGRSVFWKEPSAFDQSGYVRVESTHTPGQVFPVGSDRVSYTFVDGSNNVAICDFVVTVTQGVNGTPITIIDCPQHINTDVELGSFGSVVHWKEPKAEGTSLLVRTHAPGSYFPVGTTMVTYVFRDSANNIASCMFSIIGSTVDTKAPVVFNCPSNIHSSIESEKQDTVVTWTEPFATDLSGDTKMMSNSHKPFDSFEPGSTLVVYTFEDKQGNLAWCNFTVEVTVFNLFLSDEESGIISLAGLGLALLIGCCLLLLLIFVCANIRRKRRGDHLELNGLRALDSPPDKDETF